MRLSRRRMGGLLAGVGFFVFGGCSNGPRPSHSPHPLTAALVGLVRGRSLAAHLGRAYLWHLESAPSEQQLVDRVLPQSRQATLRGVPKWQLRQEVRERITADYARGRPVSVGGWLVSETEASLCALAAVEEERGAS